MNQDRDSQKPTSADDEKDQTDAAHPYPTPAPTDKPAAGDARGDEEKLRQNREHLGVDDEHQTPEMKKGHRGTFP